MKNAILHEESFDACARFLVAFPSPGFKTFADIPHVREWAETLIEVCEDMDDVSTVSSGGLYLHFERYDEDNLQAFCTVDALRWSQLPKEDE